MKFVLFLKKFQQPDDLRQCIKLLQRHQLGSGLRHVIQEPPLGPLATSDPLLCLSLLLPDGSVHCHSQHSTAFGKCDHNMWF